MRFRPAVAAIFSVTKRVEVILIGGRMPKFSLSMLAFRLAASLFLGLALSGSVTAQTKGAMGTDPETVAQVRAWNAECLQCHVGDSLHEQGKGLCGVYAYEIAETKVAQVRKMAKEEKFPLRAVMEEA